MVQEKIDLTVELADIQRQTNETLRIITKQGFVMETSEWLTIARYAKKYGVSTNVVSNWIAREVIPADCVKDLPELNNIRLVKDQLYR